MRRWVVGLHGAQLAMLWLFGGGAGAAVGFGGLSAIWAKTDDESQRHTRAVIAPDLRATDAPLAELKRESEGAPTRVRSLLRGAISERTMNLSPTRAERAERVAADSALDAATRSANRLSLVLLGALAVPAFWLVWATWTWFGNRAARPAEATQRA